MKTQTLYSSLRQWEIQLFNQ